MRQSFKALTVVLGVALVCSLVVTSAAVLLEAQQQRNLRLERIGNILALAGVRAPDRDPLDLYRERIAGRLVDLDRALEVKPEGLPESLHPDTFDFDRAAKDPRHSVAIPRNRIGLNRRPRFMPVYFVRGKEGMERVILLIVGKGLWSTLYGYLALDRDLVTVAGIVFFQQGETPGLGGEIANPRWQALWRGKRAYDEQGKVAIEVVKGTVAPDSPRARHQVDGLSGATLTTRAVDRMVRYWLGPEGYGLYLANLRQLMGSPDVQF